MSKHSDGGIKREYSLVHSESKEIVEGVVEIKSWISSKEERDMLHKKGKNYSVPSLGEDLLQGRKNQGN